MIMVGKMVGGALIVFFAINLTAQSSGPKLNAKRMQGVPHGIFHDKSDKVLDYVDVELLEWPAKLQEKLAKLYQRTPASKNYGLGFNLRPCGIVGQGGATGTAVKANLRTGRIPVVLTQAGGINARPLHLSGHQNHLSLGGKLKGASLDQFNVF